MIKHVVMIKLKDEAEGKSKEEHAVALKGMLEDLKEPISQIVHIEAGINLVPSARSYDICLISDFHSLDDLNIYRKHPVHQKVLDYIGVVSDSIVAVDYGYA